MRKSKASTVIDTAIQAAIEANKAAEEAHAARRSLILSAVERRPVEEQAQPITLRVLSQEPTGETRTIPLVSVEDATDRHALTALGQALACLKKAHGHETVDLTTALLRTAIGRLEAKLRQRGVLR